MKARTFLKLLFLMCISSEIANAQGNIFSNKVLVIAKDPKSAKDLVKKVPSDFVVEGRYDIFLLVKVKSLENVHLEKLRKISGVAKVQRSFAMQYLNEKCDQCSVEKDAPQKSDLKTEMECLSKVNCGKAERNRLWDQKFLASDLAQDYLRQKKIPRVTRVGIVDSGFDSELNNKFENPQSISSVNALSGEKIGIDPIGHGTRVTSKIKGGNGIGGSVDTPVTVYALLSEEPPSSSLGIGILRACEDGNEIVNVSSAFKFGPFKLSLKEVLPEEIFQRITKTGCMIVTSSGNSGLLITSDSEDSLLFDVGASTSDGKVASMTSGNTDLLAPGENVIGIYNRFEKKPDHQLECNSSSTTNESFDSGTSFSAPSFVAVQSQIRDVLIQSSWFRVLPKPQQADRIREVLKLAKRDNIPNAFLAVQIAEEWTKKPNESVQAANERFTSAQKAKCSTIQEPKCASSSCTDQDQCELDLRKFALTCGSQNLTSIKNLILFLQSRGDLESAGYWLREYARMFPENPVDTKFPGEQLVKAITANPSQGSTVRWLKHYNEWSAISKTKDETAREFLKKSADQAIFRISDLDGRDQSSAAALEVEALFNERRKLDMQQTFSITEWTDVMLKDPKRSRFLFGALILGFNDKTVPEDEMLKLLDHLLKTPERLTEQQARGTVRLLSRIDLTDKQRISYLDKFLSNDELDDDTLKELQFFANTSDASLLIPGLERISKHKNTGPKSLASIPTLLFLHNADGRFNADQRRQAIEFMQNLKNHPRLDDLARKTIDFTLKIL